MYNPRCPARRGAHSSVVLLCVSDKNNNELLKNPGNFVNRALSFTHANFDARIPLPLPAFGSREEALVSEVNGLLAEYLSLMESVNLKQALRTVMAISSVGNAYLQDAKPWAQKKSGNMAGCGLTVAVAVALARVCHSIPHHRNLPTKP